MDRACSPGSPGDPRPQGTAQEVFRQWEGCTRCGLQRTATRLVSAIGSAPAPVMLLGEGPGAAEDEKGLPFVGRSGSQVLQPALQELDVTLDEFYLTNAVKHRPPGNRDPTDDELDACSDLLSREIGFVSPRAIVCLGRVPARAMARLAGAELPQGSLHHWRLHLGSTTVSYLWHPAYVCRDMRRYPDFVSGLRDVFTRVRSRA